MKKLFSTFVVLLIAALIFTGCEPEAAPSPSPAPDTLVSTWISTFDIPAGSSHGEENFPTAFTAAFKKIEVYTSYYLVYEWKWSYWYQLEEWYETQTGTEPDPIWTEDPQDSGTYIIDGNTITFTSTNHPEQPDVATLAADRNSFTMSDESPFTHEAVTVTYVKQ